MAPITSELCEVLRAHARELIRLARTANNDALADRLEAIGIDLLKKASRWENEQHR